jgi:hypothetical protein
MTSTAKLLSIALVAAAAIAVPGTNKMQQVPASTAGMIGLAVLAPAKPEPTMMAKAKPAAHLPCACLHRLY